MTVAPLTGVRPRGDRRLQRVIARIVQVLIADHAMPEALLGVGGMLWGVWLLNPHWNTFSAAGFHALAEVAPEWAWGGLFLSVGWIQITGIACDWRTLRLAAAFAGAFVWIAVALGFLTSNVASLGGPTYTLLAMLSGWVFLRIGHEG